VTDLPDRLLDMLHAPSTGLIATTNPDGSPQLTEVWLDTDGNHVLVNTVRGFRKLRNVERDPRVAVSILDRNDPADYYSLTGTVISNDTEGAAEHLDRVSHKYTGGPYPGYSGRPQVRVLLTIRVDRIVHAPWG
jgi:PPOX class probable F420-dependent enzyme